MSTRCQIGFYKGADQSLLQPSALIYRHNDGYPNGPHGILAVLMPWAREFHQRRGLYDAEYAAARALYTLMNAASGPNEMTGYGISNGFHGDLSFYYRVDPTAVRVYRHGPFGKYLFQILLEVPVEWQNQASSSSRSSGRVYFRNSRGQFKPRPLIA